MADLVPYVLPPFFAVFGFIFIMVGARTVRSHKEFLRRAQRAPGLVVGMRTKWTSGQNARLLYYPVVRFRTVDGREVEAETDIGASPAPARERQSVTVLYDPGDPGRARVDTVLGSGATAGMLFVVIGLIFALIGVVGTMLELLVVTAR